MTRSGKNIVFWRSKDRLITSDISDSLVIFCNAGAGASHSGLRVQKNARNAWFTRISHKKQLYTDISLCFDLLLEKPLPSKGPHMFMNVLWLQFYRVVPNSKSFAVLLCTEMIKNTSYWQIFCYFCNF